MTATTTPEASAGWPPYPWPSSRLHCSQPAVGRSGTPREQAIRPGARSCSSRKCGSCHALADAGTKGQIGPNLDDAFRESRLSGLGESTIVQVVRGQIAYPITTTSTGAPGMPADLVAGQDADDVASYVGKSRRQVARPRTTAGRQLRLQARRSGTDHMRDRAVEAGTRRRDDSLLEPGGVSCRMGRDHDLVGGELPQRSLESHQGVGVAELTPRHDPCDPQGGDGLAQALLVGPSGGAIVLR